MIKLFKKIYNTTSKGFYFLCSVISKGFFYYFYAVCSFVEKLFNLLKSLFKRLQRDPSASFAVIFIFLVGVFFYTYIYSSSNSFVKIKLNDITDNVINDKKSENNDDTSNSGVTMETNLFRIYGKTNIDDINFTELSRVNSDVVAWLIVDSTNINYPIVKTSDNDFYLNHNFNKINDSNGWTFMDYRNSGNMDDENTIFYGHNLMNKTSFGSISSIFTDKWYKNSNHSIVVVTANGRFTYKIFSVYYSEPDSSYLQTNYNDSEQYLEFLNTLKSKSKYNFKEELNANDKIITLSTCTDDNKGRKVVHARLIK